MKPEIRILTLFVFPVVALFACAAVSFSMQGPRPYTHPRPQFIDYIERLEVTTGDTQGGLAPEQIRNVFLHEDAEQKDPAPAEPPKPVDPAPKQASREPVWVSMIVEGGPHSFCIINGQKMRIGERSDSFTLTAIRKGSVTIRHTDGIEETIHVKAF